MKKLILLTMAILAMVGTTNAQKLSNGKAIQIRLTSEIKSNTKIPSEVTAIVDKDVKDNADDNILIKRGTPVKIDATIIKAKGVGKPAEIKLLCLSTTAVDGQEIALQGSLLKVGENRNGVALGVGIGVGLFCWPAIFCLCIKGEKLTLPENTIIHNVVINDDYVIKSKEFGGIENKELQVIN